MSSQLCSFSDSNSFQPVEANGGQFMRNSTISESCRSDELGINSSLCDGRRLSPSKVVTTLTANLLEYSWVVQHHSVSSYPDYWSQPVKLLTEFCQTEDYKSRLAACISASATEDAPSHVHGGSVVDVVQSKLPASMEMKCLVPHHHRWNPCMSSDFGDYFHDRIKILSTGVAVYRCHIQLHLIVTVCSFII